MKDDFSKEREQVYPVAPDASMFNERGAFTLPAYQSVINEVIAKHLENMGLTVSDMISRWGVAWVLLSLSAEIKRPLRQGDRFSARTWASAKSKAVYRRDMEIYGEDGEAVIMGAAFSTILDIKTRRICSSAEIHSLFNLPAIEGLIEAGGKPDFSGLEFEHVEKRRVRPSFIDGLGHVNNLRYGELAYDAMSDDERERMDSLRRLDIWFLREIRLGDEVWMEKAESGSTVWLRGVVEGAEKPAFAVKLEFEA